MLGSFRTPLFAAAVSLLLAVFASSCADSHSGYEVNVVAITDVVPYFEFNSVRTSELSIEERYAMPERSLRVDANIHDAYARGVSVARFRSVQSGERVFLVELLRADDTVVVKRRVNVNIGADTTINVHLTADCIDVACPGPSGNTALSECLAGQCVDPRCDPSTEQGRMYCEGVEFCSEASQCEDVAACAEQSCVEHICHPHARQDMCEQGTWCQPEQGCIPSPILDQPDAAIDAFVDVPDAQTPPDAARTCQVCTQVPLEDGRIALVCDFVPCDSLVLADAGHDAPTMMPDMFVPQEDMFVSPPDMFVPQEDMFVSPPDMFVPQEDMFVSPPDMFMSMPDMFVAVDMAPDGPVTCLENEKVRSFTDVDHDGYGDMTSLEGIGPTSFSMQCPGAYGFAEQPGDCASMLASINPGATEACNLVDDNCDGIVDGAAADADCGTGSYCLHGACVDEDDCLDLAGVTVTGNITTSNVWCSSTNTIRMEGLTLIRADVHIVVVPGTTLLMADATSPPTTNASVTVRGSLELHGTSASPIEVMSAESVPAIGDWDGFSAQNTSTAPHIYVEHSRIRHASVALTSEAHQNQIVVNNSTLSNNGNGLSWGRARNTLFSNNTIGVDGDSYIYGSEFKDNDTAIGGWALLAYDTSIHDNMVAFAGSVAYATRLVRSEIFDNNALRSSNGNIQLIYSRITGNGEGLRTSGGSLTLQYSTICDNDGDELRVESASDANVPNNYWCTTSAPTIDSYIYDCNEAVLNGCAAYTPILTQPDPWTPAYIP